MIKQPTTSTARRFVDQVCLITGAVGGIGTAIAGRLAAEGAVVQVADRDADACARVVEDLVLAGGRAEVRAFDLTDPDACAAAVRDVVDEHGRLDVLVNNAGVNRRGALLDLAADDWAATFAVNVDALVHLCRAVLPTMINAGQGAIVNTASQWGLSPAPGHVAYNTSKAAVVAFTQNLARDYAPAGVRVNAVCPGEVWTPMLEANLARSGRTKADLDALVPYGRVGLPEEIAALVAFLASDEAPYLCGAAVEITGAQAVA
ncbi:SDR family NAD(P)-dependent oxidoreductase [Microlunatus antarcticus]|uniref:NAD(P)-dependent dehydrogenase (Short-subunit alcohol dehydrogenase family) n=1 Tax=Microlunatus antarcticus TaxID=53388 RepID=A0A7W5P848_9ACTN|nr:SDR family NAD(P)-dependent oxidoreductase [Microlunatus antarcticus]MBB3328249.1 NAD(P)-dependent dehydrogenase (short-subunit alcohol dehydrogenase family) [Microlunatus antarcticus]